MKLHKNKESVSRTTTRAFSVVETLLGIGIFTLVFITLYSSFQAMVTFGEQNKLRSNAILLANEHIEKMRAYPYDSIGTIGGIPSGSIPQIETISYAGHTYTRRTFIQYVDDPADGLDAADSLAADYKRIKVEMSYTYNNSPQSFSFVTTMAPKSQESLAGAGVLKIHVIDADNDPVFLSTVHIKNTSIATSVDITTFTNASGTISFPGAWAGNGYEVYVSKDGYSSAQTYLSTTTNPNPSPSPLSVAVSATTEIYFKIDLLSSIHLITKAWPTRSRFLETFADASGISLFTNTEVLADSLLLTGGAGLFAPSGSAVSTPFTPPDIKEWLLFSFTDTKPANTSVAYHIEYDTGGGVFALVPDALIPQNSTGLTSSPVSLGSLSSSTHSTLRVVIDLSTTDQTVTPEVHEFKLSYHETDTPIPNVPFTLRGNDTIGTDASMNPIYKYTISDQTDAQGSWSSGDISFDSYELTLSGYTIADACPTLPIVLEPDTDLTQTVILEASTPDSLRLQIKDGSGNAIERAEVRITNGTIDETRSTSACGYVYFGALSNDSYSITVDAPNFVHYSDTVSVSGETNEFVTLSS